MTKMRRCPVCGSPVKPENLSRHLKKVHPGEDTETHVPKPKKSRRGASQREGVIIACIAIAVVAIVVIAFTYQGDRGSLVGKQAPSFNIVDVTTQTPYSMPANYRGELIFLEFFSPSCVHCVAFIPTMRSLYDAYHTAPHFVNFISIDTNPYNDTDDLRQFVAAHPESVWDHSLDISNAADDYNIQGTPHFFIIDLKTDPSQAIVKYDHAGIDAYSNIAAELDRLLGG